MSIWDAKEKYSMRKFDYADFSIGRGVGNGSMGRFKIYHPDIFETHGEGQKVNLGFSNKIYYPAYNTLDPPTFAIDFAHEDFLFTEKLRQSLKTLALN